jgi:hypothetical protein
MGKSYQPVIHNKNKSFICTDRGGDKNSATKRVRLFLPMPTLASLLWMRLKWNLLPMVVL